jgi:hypothetical protein
VPGALGTTAKQQIQNGTYRGDVLGALGTVAKQQIQNGTYRGDVPGALGTTAKQQIQNGTYKGAIKGGKGSKGSLEKVKITGSSTPTMTASQAHGLLISEGMADLASQCKRCAMQRNGKKMPRDCRHNKRCVEEHFPEEDFSEPGRWKKFRYY